MSNARKEGRSNVLKKTTRAILYWLELSSRSIAMPAILALPMLENALF